MNAFTFAIYETKSIPERMFGTVIKWFQTIKRTESFETVAWNTNMSGYLKRIQGKI